MDRKNNMSLYQTDKNDTTKKYSCYFLSSVKYPTHNDEQFCKWIDKVENIVMREISMNLLDLEDVSN